MEVLDLIKVEFCWRKTQVSDYAPHVKGRKRNAERERHRSAASIIAFGGAMAMTANYCSKTLLNKNTWKFYRTKEDTKGIITHYVCFAILIVTLCILLFFEFPNKWKVHVYEYIRVDILRKILHVQWIIKNAYPRK